MSESLIPDIRRILDDCTRIVDDILPADMHDEGKRTEARKQAIAVSLAMSQHMIGLINVEREEAETFNELVLIDPITGIHNRKGFEQDVKNAALEAQQQGTPLTIVTLDLNGLDEVNDQQGRKEGDRWIETTALILSKHFTAMASRWGGDEYSVVLPDYSESAVEHWWQDVNHAFTKSGINVGAGAVTLYIETNADVTSLLASNLVAADEALTVAKAESKACGQNCLVQTAMVVGNGV